MADDKKQTGETTKPQPKPAKRRTNKRLELAQVVKEKIAAYGNAVENAQSVEQLFDATLLVGTVIGRAKEGGVDETTMGFAEDLVRQHMAKAITYAMNSARAGKAE